MISSTDTTVDLTAWGIKSKNGRDVYHALQRLQHQYGRSIPYNAITDAVRLSNKEILAAILEIENAGLVVVDVGRQDIQLIG